ncbi:MAG: DUF1538 family protein, partial [Spirochaetia bacterium]|nr:DUF1538 family protein [Spirochaetia bacterium]
MPIIVIVLLLNFTIAPVGSAALVRFLVDSVLVIIGLTLFLVGADLGISPIGQKAGAALTAKRKLLLLIGAAFAIGFFITIAEPDVQVLATQVVGVNPAVPKIPLILMIAVGVGFFVVVGLLRIVFNLSYRWLLIISYGVVFLCAYYTSPDFMAVGFDAGGATTGPMTVPFIIALGVGVASSKGGAANRDSSFGLTGIASIGPILAVFLLGIFTKGSASASAAGSHVEFAGFIAVMPEIAKEILSSLLPMAVMFIIFQLTLIHMPPYQVRRMIKGLIYTYIGLVLFMTGVQGGFMMVGSTIGAVI